MRALLPLLLVMLLAACSTPRVLPPGSYTVTATFGGAADVDAPDPFFAGSTSASATLVLRDVTAPTITARAAVTGGAPYTAGTWTNGDVTVTLPSASMR